ncbi:MAG TPA: YtxH domain-containing protein [Actinomycetota bacterium]|nr:YtxH domain-containing protein [Actinomycetota bacterium]
MRGRLGLFVGFGAGYVLGAKAGKERYDQLQRLYDNLKRSPAVRSASGRAKEAAETGFDTVKEKAGEGVAKVQEVVKERRSGTDGSTGLTVAPPLD